MGLCHSMSFLNKYNRSLQKSGGYFSSFDRKNYELFVEVESGTKKELTIQSSDKKLPLLKRLWDLLK